MTDLRRGRMSYPHLRLLAMKESYSGPVALILPGGSEVHGTGHFRNLLRRLGEGPAAWSGSIELPVEHPVDHMDLLGRKLDVRVPGHRTGTVFIAGGEETTVHVTGSGPLPF